MLQFCDFASWALIKEKDDSMLEYWSKYSTIIVDSKAPCKATWKKQWIDMFCSFHDDVVCDQDYMNPLQLHQYSSMLNKKLKLI